MPELIERDAKAKRQDLSDKLHLADQKKTPFISAVAKGTAPISTLGEWATEKYPDPVTEGAVDEQDVQDYEKLEGPDEVLQGRLQIWERKPKVSRLAQVAMAAAGVPRKKAFAKALAKGLIMLKRDMEATCLGDNESRVGTNAQGYKIRGLGRWIQNGAQADLPVPAAYRTPAASIFTGAIGDINDDTIVGIMQSMFDETGDSDMNLTGWVGSSLKRAVSALTWHSKTDADFVNVRSYNADAGADTITRKVDVLDTDFGRAVLRLSSFINTGGDPKSAASKRLGYIMPMTEDAVRMRFATEPHSRELEDKGGGPRALIEAIGRLEVGNPLWMGKIAATA